MTITMTPYNERLHEVRRDKRMIGFVMLVNNQSHIASGWRFIPARPDIAKLYPAPSPVFDTADLALAAAKTKIGE